VLAASTDQNGDPKWYRSACARDRRLSTQNYIDHAGGRPAYTTVDIYIGCRPRPEQIAGCAGMLQERIQKARGHSSGAEAERAMFGPRWAIRGTRQGKGRGGPLVRGGCQDLILDRSSSSSSRAKSWKPDRSTGNEVGARGRHELAFGGGAISARRSCDRAQYVHLYDLRGRLVAKPRFRTGHASCIPGREARVRFGRTSRGRSLDRFRWCAHAGRNWFERRGV